MEPLVKFESIILRVSCHGSTCWWSRAQVYHTCVWCVLFYLHLVIDAQSKVFAKRRLVSISTGRRADWKGSYVSGTSALTNLYLVSRERQFHLILELACVCL